MIRYRKLSLVLGMMIIFTASCTFDELPYNENEVPDEVSFSEHMIPYFETSCSTSGCHDGTIPPNLTADVAYNALIIGGYVDTDNPDQSLIYTKVAEGGSMYDFATDYDREITLKWIEQGAEDN